jgi:hypothetical protein
MDMNQTKTSEMKTAEVKKTAAEIEQLLAQTPAEQQPQVLADFVFGKGVTLV